MKRAEVPITVATPAIPPRVCNGLLQAAADSVSEQTVKPTGGMSVSVDVLKEGPGVVRQRALDAVRTDWTAFLDDDDYFYPHHLERLYGLVKDHDADVAYGWFDGNKPFPMLRGRQFNHDEPHHTTMTLLVRTELAKSIGFTAHHPDGWALPSEDWQFILGCSAAGAKFIGTGDVTWHYRVHGKNTSGLPERW